MKITNSRMGSEWRMEYEVGDKWLDFDGLVELAIDAISEGEVPEWEIQHYGERRVTAALERYWYMTEVLSVG